MKASVPVPVSTASPRAKVIRELRELIAALDRRVPHVERAGEVSIANEAAVLRALAVTRLEELERELSPPVSR